MRHAADPTRIELGEELSHESDFQQEGYAGADPYSHLTPRAAPGIDHGQERTTDAGLVSCGLNVQDRSIDAIFFPPFARALAGCRDPVHCDGGGGLAFYLIGFPGGLVSGSMLTVALAALAGRPMKIPLPLARLCFVLVGILLGAVSRRKRSTELQLGR